MNNRFFEFGKLSFNENGRNKFQLKWNETKKLIEEKIL